MGAGGHVRSGCTTRSNDRSGEATHDMPGGTSRVFAATSPKKPSQGQMIRPPVTIARGASRSFQDTLVGEATSRIDETSPRPPGLSRTTPRGTGASLAMSSCAAPIRAARPPASVFGLDAPAGAAEDATRRAVRESCPGAGAPAPAQSARSSSNMTIPARRATNTPPPAQVNARASRLRYQAPSLR